MSFREGLNNFLGRKKSDIPDQETQENEVAEFSDGDNKNKGILRAGVFNEKGERIKKGFKNRTDDYAEIHLEDKDLIEIDENGKKTTEKDPVSPNAISPVEARKGVDKPDIIRNTEGGKAETEFRLVADEKQGGPGGRLIDGNGVVHNIVSVETTEKERIYKTNDGKVFEIKNEKIIEGRLEEQQDKIKNQEKALTKDKKYLVDKILGSTDEEKKRRLYIAGALAAGLIAFPLAGGVAGVFGMGLGQAILGQGFFYGTAASAMELVTYFGGLGGAYFLARLKEDWDNIENKKTGEVKNKETKPAETQEETKPAEVKTETKENVDNKRLEEIKKEKEMLLAQSAGFKESINKINEKIAELNNSLDPLSQCIKDVEDRLKDLDDEEKNISGQNTEVEANKVKKDKEEPEKKEQSEMKETKKEKELRKKINERVDVYADNNQIIKNENRRIDNFVKELFALQGKKYQYENEDVFFEAGEKGKKDISKELGDLLTKFKESKIRTNDFYKELSKLATSIKKYGSK